MSVPVNTVLPAISGTATVGAALALSDGTWTGSPTSYAYAWLRDGVAISGATTNAYTVVLADVAAAITGRVTATNSDGSTAATSSGQTVPTTLIVEDGSMVPSANAYISRAAADTYHTGVGNAAWAALTAGNKESSIRRATIYMEEFYRQSWKGWRVSSVQVLCWPRANVQIPDTPYWTLVATTVVPTEVANACAELALRAASASLAPDLARGTSSVTIGPISKVYDKTDVQYTRYRAINALLAPFLMGSSSNVRLIQT